MCNMQGPLDGTEHSFPVLELKNYALLPFFSTVVTEHVSERNGSEEEGEKRGETIMTILRMRGAIGGPPGLPPSGCRCPHALGKVSAEQPCSAPQCRGGPATGHSLSLYNNQTHARCLQRGSTHSMAAASGTRVRMNSLSFPTRARFTGQWKHSERACHLFPLRRGWRVIPKIEVGGWGP